jgi:hypothetical protein
MTAADERRQVSAQRIGFGVVQLRRQRAASQQDLGSQFSLRRLRHGVHDDRSLPDTAKPTERRLRRFSAPDAVIV